MLFRSSIDELFGGQIVFRARIGRDHLFGREGISQQLSKGFTGVRAISDTRDGDGREYMEKALFACEQEERLLKKFFKLWQSRNAPVQ